MLNNLKEKKSILFFFHPLSQHLYLFLFIMLIYEIDIFKLIKKKKKECGYLVLTLKENVFKGSIKKINNKQWYGIVFIY